jgi:hypothetical protein
LPRSMRCAAAANPTGPAPITTTGRVPFMLLILQHIDARRFKS